MADSIDTLPHYRAGIELFNKCEFFEAHDVWEEVWAEYRGPSRTFYKGLIQVAVALHHFGNGNIRGAKNSTTVPGPISTPTGQCIWDAI